MRELWKSCARSSASQVRSDDIDSTKETLPRRRPSNSAYALTQRPPPIAQTPLTETLVYHSSTAQRRRHTHGKAHSPLEHRSTTQTYSQRRPFTTQASLNDADILTKTLIHHSSIAQRGRHTRIDARPPLSQRSTTHIYTHGNARPSLKRSSAMQASTRQQSGFHERASEGLSILVKIESVK